jgi:hypothetical protein
MYLEQCSLFRVILFGGHLPIAHASSLSFGLSVKRTESFGARKNYKFLHHQHFSLPFFNRNEYTSDREKTIVESTQKQKQEYYCLEIIFFCKHLCCLFGIINAAKLFLSIKILLLFFDDGNIFIQ